MHVAMPLFHVVDHHCPAEGIERGIFESNAQQWLEYVFSLLRAPAYKIS